MSGLTETVSVYKTKSLQCPQNRAYIENALIVDPIKGCTEINLQDPSLLPTLRCKRSHQVLYNYYQMAIEFCYYTEIDNNKSHRNKEYTCYYFTYMNLLTVINIISILNII